MSEATFPSQRLKLEIAYDGTDFFGWQTQRKPTEQPTIQDQLHSAAARLYHENIHFHGSGRTDSGVHAWGQMAHIDLPHHLPFEKMNLPAAFRRYLPPTIIIKRAWLAPREFHAQRSAVQKTYKYLIFNNNFPHPLLRNQTHWYKYDLDLAKLQRMSELLVGKMDYASFQSQGTPVHTTVRSIYELNWKRKGSGLIEMRITGSGFLKQMVRNIVGTLIQLQREPGEGVHTLQEILDARDRQAAGPTAPAKGLCLWRVNYNTDLDRKCHRL